MMGYYRTRRGAGFTLLAALLTAASLASAQSFINFETPQVAPLTMTPNGERLLAVNTADGRLEVFSLESGTPVLAGEVPVGIDPVTVRTRGNSRAWVVNHVSDSISIVDLNSLSVVATLQTGDEPTDLVFAGDPVRAYVSCSQANLVQVFDPSNLAAPPLEVPINGEDPRALSVSPDGSEVYLAVFESGNASTIIAGSHTALALPLNDNDGPYGGQEPVPNDGMQISPAMNPDNPAPPRTSLLVKKAVDGRWMDDNDGDWTEFVSGSLSRRSERVEGWDMPDRDLAVIDTDTLEVRYVRRLMNHNMAMTVNPQSGLITVVGTDGTNEIRFEPNLNGTFIRVLRAQVDPQALEATVTDLNPHLDYESSTVDQATRDLSVGDPRGAAWNAQGTRLYVVGRGSNNVVVLDGDGDRVLAEPIDVGEGPTGVVVDDAREQLYVLNQFDASVSTVNTTALTETARTAFFDPTPAAIRAGRRHLYNTRQTSGLGQAACASCHTDARMDRLAWDLGDPTGIMKSTADANKGAWNNGLRFGFDDQWHPMKGPMVTQTLQDVIGKEPHHWRGDRAGIEVFNATFVNLQGDDEALNAQEMQDLEDFLATIHFPPNPYRELDNSLPTNLPLDGFFGAGNQLPKGEPVPNGNAQRGLENFILPNRADAPFACSTCHTLPTGLGPNLELDNGELVEIPPGPNGEAHIGFVSIDGDFQRTLKVPHLRNLYERIGFDTTQPENNAGFGFHHDGSFDSLSKFFRLGFPGIADAQDLADMIAFMLAFSGSELPAASDNTDEPMGPMSQDSHAAVGQQLTIARVGQLGAGGRQRLVLLLRLAREGAVELTAKGLFEDELRGYLFDGAGRFQADREGEVLTLGELLSRASPTTPLTLTVVANGTGTRIGIDRDEDGVYDGDDTPAQAL